MMSADSLAGEMRAAARSLLASLDGEQRELAKTAADKNCAAPSPAMTSDRSVY